MSDRAHDLTLAPVAAATWSATALALCCGPWVGWAGATAAVIVAAGLVAAVIGAAGLTAAAPASWVWTVIGALILGAAAAGVTGMRVHLRDTSAVAQLAQSKPAALRITVQFSEFPRQLGGGDASGASPYSTSRVLIAARTHRGAAVVIIGQADDFAAVVPGQSGVITAAVLPNTRPDLSAALLVARGPPQQLTAPPWHHAMSAALRGAFATVCAAHLSDPSAGMLPALVLGDELRTAPTVRADFAASDWDISPLFRGRTSPSWRAACSRCACG